VFAPLAPLEQIANLTLTASAGLRMREAGLQQFESVAFMDRSLGEKRRYRIIGASRASELQSAAKADMLTLDDLRLAVDREFAEMPVK
jgi:hypothetical protein